MHKTVSHRHFEVAHHLQNEYLCACSAISLMLGSTHARYNLSALTTLTLSSSGHSTLSHRSSFQLLSHSKMPLAHTEARQNQTERCRRPSSKRNHVDVKSINNCPSPLSRNCRFASGKCRYKCGTNTELCTLPGRETTRSASRTSRLASTGRYSLPLNYRRCTGKPSPNVHYKAIQKHSVDRE